MLTRFLRFLAIAALAVAFPVGAHHVPDSSDAANSAIAAEATLSGAVEELSVIDQVNGTSQRYPILRQDNGGRVALRGDAIQTLQAGARVSVTGSQTGTTFTVTRIDSLDASGRAAVKAAAGETLEGTFLVAHADNFENGTSNFIYQVEDASGGVREITMPFLPGALWTGMQVVVQGNTDANSQVVPSTITITSMPVGGFGGPSGPLAATTTNYLVIPIKFKSADGSYPADPFTPASLNNAVFGSLPTYKSAKEFYNEVSYGQQQLSGTVASNAGAFLTSTVVMPASGTGVCDINKIATEAENAATAKGFNVASYTGRLYVFNNVPGCGWAGLAYVGWARAYANNTSALWVVAHELGHNFGLLHAGSLRCTGATIGCGAAGSVAEYGDPFSAMGNSGSAGHFNAAQKDILGWFSPSQVKTHAGGVATYTLSPIETASQPVYGVKIPTSNPNRTYWIEYRQPTGAIDAFLSSPNYPNNGAQIRIEYPFEKSSGSDDTEILDMTPATTGTANSGFGDAALLAGAAPFTDPSTNVTINVLSATPGANGILTVQVSTAAGGPSTTTLASSANPSNAGAVVTFTATVTGTSPAGSVNFKDAGASIAGCTASAVSGSGNSRTATCSTSTLATGTHSIVANYSGDAGNAASTSAALSQVVKAAASGTVLASSLNPSTSGASVTFTASVTGVAPTGSVNFKDGASSIAGCSAVALSGSGNTRTATCATSALSVATHSITAAYAGDAGNAASTSAALSQVVKAAASGTVLASSLNPSTSGASVTFTASVTGVAPTGSVNFKDGASSIAGCSAVALSGSGNTRTATCATSALSVATHSITAAYAGDAGNAASTSAALSQVVKAAASGTVLASSLNPSTSGASVTFTASVTGVAPTGSVNFKDGASSIAGCSAVALSGSGNTRTATCATSALSVATHSITAAYAGDAGNAASTSAALSQVVKAAASGTVLASSLNPSTSGASVTFTASVTGVAPTGSVNFKDGASSIAGCSAVALSGSGNTRTATCATSALSVATHSITAAYAGDAGNAASTSAALSQVVKAAASGTVLASSLNPSTSGASVTFTASVTGVAPTGSVNFKDGASSIAGCSAVALSGSGNTRTATCATSALSVATHSITAAYAGDAGNAASTSAALSQVVNSIGGGGGSINVALASNGGVASASSTNFGGFGGLLTYPVSAVNNGDRAGLNWGHGGGWMDGTGGVFPDWVEIDFNGSKTIDHVAVYSVQDNSASPVDPPNTLTFSLYGITDFQVQAWNGSAWVTLGSVAGNNLVKRTVSFAATATSRIRVNVTGAKANYSRITEIEAWTGSGGPVATSAALASSLNPSTSGANVTFTASVTGVAPTGSVNFKDGASSIAGCSAVALSGSGNTRTATCATSALSVATHSITAAYAGDASNAASTSAALSQVVNSGGGGQINVALTSNGGVASASSTNPGGFGGTTYPVSAVNNGDRAGLNWGHGGGWMDGTGGVFPDWVEIDFNGSKTIDHVAVYSVQDNSASPVDPPDTLTFSLYGITDFQVQAWNGSAWVTLGSVAGNNLVKRTVSFAATATSRIRVNVTGAKANYSRMVEVEAWGN